MVSVIGDSILDEYIYGSLIQKDFPIFKPLNKHYLLGGAGNVVLNIKRMGSSVAFFSVLGDSEKSDIFKSLLVDKGIFNTFIITDKSRDICLKTRIVSDNKVLVRIDNDYTAKLSEQISNQLYNQLRYNIRETKVMIISNYYKGCITEELFIKIKKLCEVNDVKILLDCSKKHDFDGIYLLKPNLAELENMIGRKFDGLNDIIETAMKFKQYNHIHNMLLTMDKDGLILIDEDNNYVKMKSLCTNIVDTCGAGDTMISAIALCLANGVDLKSAVQFANYAAAVCCENMGTYAVSLNDIHNFWSRVNI